MAIDYTNLFEDLGEFLEVMNNCDPLMASTIGSYETEIDVQLTANGRYDVLSGVPEIFEGFKDTVRGWVTTLGNKVKERLQHFSTIVDELDLPVAKPSMTTLLYELYRDMVDNSESIDGSTVTVGAVTSDLYQSDGLLILDKVLDGVSSPSSGWPACLEYAYDVANGHWPGQNANYAGTPSELASNEAMVVTCIADHEGGASEGAESFRWDGEVKPRSAYDWQFDGSGNGPTITVANGSGLLTNGEFENFTGDAPDNWDIDNGAAGYEIFDETSAQKRGSKCLKITGDGSEATIGISQTLSNLTAGKRYFVACWVKGDATVAAGTLTIKMAGTGYTAGTSEKISMTAAALAAQTTFGIESFFFNAPLDIPSDFEIVIEVTDTLTNGADILIDGLVLAEAVWHGGICAGIIAGADPFLVGDRFTFSVSNTGVGAFQEMFRKLYHHQLPSDLTGSETISDGLASD